MQFGLARTYSTKSEYSKQDVAFHQKNLWLWKDRFSAENLIKSLNYIYIFSQATLQIFLRSLSSKIIEGVQNIANIVYSEYC